MAHHVVVVGIYRSRCRAKNSIHKNQHIVQTVVGVAATAATIVVAAAVVEKDNVGRERVKNSSSAALNGGGSSVQGPSACLVVHVQ